MNDMSMSVKAKVLFAIAALAAVPVLALGGLYGCFLYNDALRIQDAAPAFEPLEPLKPVLFSQPYGSRYCRYVLDFPEESLRNDDNAVLLESLNLLPKENTLDVTVRTKRITDASLPALLKLTSIDWLDVTESTISDDGIAQLKAGIRTNPAGRKLAPV